VIYSFRCRKCNEVYQINQGMKEEHVYNCPECGYPCQRLFDVPEINNAKPGFYSEMLGRYVKDTHELDHGLEEVYYKHDINKYLDNNRTPDPQWVDEKARDEAEQAQRTELESEAIDEYHHHQDWCEKIETYNPDRGVFGV